MARSFADTFRRLRRTIRWGGAAPEIAPDLPDRDWRWVREQIEAALAQTDDPTTRRAHIAIVAGVYETLDDRGRAVFLRSVAHEFGIDPMAASEAASALVDEPTDHGLQQRARRALTPAYAELLHLLTGLDSGVKFLVDLRADLRRLVRGEVPLLAHELEGHLATLFDVGLLELERITWDSSARLLEKLIAYEAVHEIDGWDDLRNRLDTDRRCFAFLHPSMPAEPVVFVEIALIDGPPVALAPLLDRDAPTADPTKADTAVFYSITSCQKGLAGINLGNELLKHVVRELRSEFPNLNRFATLSPIPSLRDGLADDRVRAELDAYDWRTDPEREAAVRDRALRAIARYLSTPIDGRVPDPVGNFHLSNGAAVADVLWAANTEPYGMERSWGVMVSYRYDPERIAETARAYASTGTVAVSDRIRKLAAEPH